MFRTTKHYEEERLALRKVDRASNCDRVYSMRRTKDLFQKPAIEIIWGRRGAARARIEPCRSVEERERRWAELVNRRARHGYVLDE